MSSACERCGEVHPKCAGHRNRDGRPCGGQPLRGSDLCNIHLINPKSRAKAVLRAEVMDTMGWGLDEVADVDLVQFALTRIKQAGKRADGYAAKLRELTGASDDFVDVVVGDAYGEGGKTGEYVRGLVRLEGEERDRAMGWVFKALSVGVEAKRVELAQAAQAQMAEVLREFLAHPELQLSAAQRAVAPAVLRQVLGLSGALTIEGSTE